VHSLLLVFRLRLPAVFGVRLEFDPCERQRQSHRDLLINVTAMLGLLEALKRRGGGRVVFASSGGTVYGKLKSAPVSEDALLAPISAYGASKVTAEIYLRLYRTMHNLGCGIARIANPYGAGQNLSRGLGLVTTFLHHGEFRWTLAA
jgi:UDP-glucose 4-epimerase